jgi:hypothetical protein
MRTLISFFGEALSDAREHGGWDGVCVFCGKAPYTDLAHNQSRSESNIKIFGKTLVDAPIIQVLPSCRECNSGIHSGYAREIKHFPPILASLARDSWDRFFAAAFNDPKIISKIEKISGNI